MLYTQQHNAGKNLVPLNYPYGIVLFFCKVLCKVLLFSRRARGCMEVDVRCGPAIAEYYKNIVYSTKAILPGVAPKSVCTKDIPL